jgi:hypothetical protein
VKVFFSEAHFVFLSSPSTPFAHAIRISTHTQRRHKGWDFPLL